MSDYGLLIRVGGEHGGREVVGSVNGEGTRWSRLAWLAVPLAVALLAGTVVLGWGRPAVGIRPPFSATYLATAVGTVSFVVAGSIIVSRHPRNRVGWLVVVTPLVHALAEFVTEYALRGLLVEPGAWSAAVTADWLAQWVRSPAFALGPLILLLFPDGRPLSRRWRHVTGLVVGLGVLVLVVAPAVSWGHRGRYVIEGHRTDMLGALHTDVLLPAMVLTVPLAVVALILRHRRGDAVTRLQVRWFALGAVIIGTSVVFIGLGLDQRTGAALEAAGMVVLSIALGVALLRYRLYEIDRIISRTVSYGLVVAVLGAVYVGVVVSVGTALSTVTGEDSSAVAVAASVLVVAALFRPVHGRVQRAVNRRFNRTGYEAHRAVDRLARVLREEVDLDAIEGAVATTAAVAFQPTSVSLWLNSGED